MLIHAEMSSNAVKVELGRRFKAARLNKKWSQVKLCETSGVSETTLRNLEKGKNVELDAIIAVLRALGKLADINHFLPEVPAVSNNMLNKRNEVRVRAPKASFDEKHRTSSWSTSKVGEPTTSWSTSWSDPIDDSE